MCHNIIKANSLEYAIVGGILVVYNPADSYKTKNQKASPEHLQLITNSVKNTIVYNFAEVVDGIYGRVCAPDVMNNIVWTNSYSSDDQISRTVETYSDVEGVYTAIGKLDEDPEFIDSLYLCLCDSSNYVDSGSSDQMYSDFEDPYYPGNPWWLAQVTLINDTGHCGKLSLIRQLWDWPMLVEEASLNLVNFTLEQNYPNSFNPNLVIEYEITERKFVEFGKYDFLFSEVEVISNGGQGTIYYKINFNDLNLVISVYLYQLKAIKFIEAKKILIKKYCGDETNFSPPNY